MGINSVGAVLGTVSFILQRDSYLYKKCSLCSDYTVSAQLRPDTDVVCYFASGGTVHNTHFVLMSERVYKS